MTALNSALAILCLHTFSAYVLRMFLFPFYWWLMLVEKDLRNKMKQNKCIYLVQLSRYFITRLHSSPRAFIIKHKPTRNYQQQPSKEALFSYKCISTDWTTLLESLPSAFHLLWGWRWSVGNPYLNSSLSLPWPHSHCHSMRKSFSSACNWICVCVRWPRWRKWGRALVLWQSMQNEIRRWRQWASLRYSPMRRILCAAMDSHTRAHIPADDLKSALTKWFEFAVRIIKRILWCDYTLVTTEKIKKHV